MEEIIQEALNKGVELHVAGEYDLASQLYASVIKLQPDHPDANHNMGVLKLTTGHDLEALPFLQTALQANTNCTEFWLSYIKALVKLEKLEDAARILDLAKESGIESEEFVELIQLINPPTESAPVSEPEADIPSQSEPNILDSLKLNQALRLAEKKAKEGNTNEALGIYKDILAKFPKNKQAQQKLAAIDRSQHSTPNQNPPEDIINNLSKLYNQGQLSAVVQNAKAHAQQYPASFMIWNLLGAAAAQTGQLDQAIVAFERVIAIQPDNADGYNNLGNALKEKGKLNKAIEFYKKALAIRPDFATAYNNMGITLQKQDKLDDAIEAYNIALSLKPDYADAYNNIGSTLHDQGKLSEAITFYEKAILQKDDYANAYNNMGTTLQDQGKLDAAIEAYKKALSVNPYFTEAHRNLSNLTNYTPDNCQISEVGNLLRRNNLSDADRCNLHYCYAKIQEDLGNLSGAFDNYVTGGAIRKKLLAYESTQDEHLFSRIKKTAQKLKEFSLNKPNGAMTLTPFFILGMPRSGTTLVEQIVSCHTEVAGPGELNYISRFGLDLAVGKTPPDRDTVHIFRERYIAELAKWAGRKAFITDKMPDNFKYIALICSAFPEAKIIHVHRQAKATCWSNFKHYFTSEGLSYSYDLSDTVSYYMLYKDLMNFWQRSYGDRIYNLDYDKLTEDQEAETRRLIEHLGIEWQDRCLAPQNNKRSVRTASQHQVRQPIYKGSSQAWRKFEPYLNGIFDKL